MTDYGVLKQMKAKLRGDARIQARGLDQLIYFNPPENEPSMIVLELEEIWTNLPLGDGAPHTKVRFKASTILEACKSNDALDVSGVIQHTLDGRTFDVDEGMKATLRLAGSVIDLPKRNQPRCVHQYYEALIRT